MEHLPTSARRRVPASSLLLALRGDRHMSGAYLPTRDARTAVAPEPRRTARPDSAERAGDTERRNDQVGGFLSEIAPPLGAAPRR